MKKTQNMFSHKLVDQDNIPLKLPSLQLNGIIIEKEIILDEHLTWKKQCPENCPPVRVRFWVSVRVRFRVWGQFPRGQLS